MSFRIRVGEPDLKAMRRIALSQIRRLRQRGGESQADPEAVIHDLRIGAKKLRALLRLYREPLGTAYDQENALIRDAARSLSGVRDTTAMLECLHRLGVPEEPEHPRRGRAPTPVDVPESVLAVFSSQRAEALATADHEAAIAGFTAMLDGLEKLIETRHFRSGSHGQPGWLGGFARTYGRARRGFRRCTDRAADDWFHDWRKRVKYHRFHLQLLAAAWPRWFAPRIDRLRQLGDVLGHEHDLSVLLTRLADRPERFGNERVLAQFRWAVTERRQRTRQDGRSLARRLFSQAPAALGADIATIHRLARELQHD